MGGSTIFSVNHGDMRHLVLHYVPGVNVTALRSMLIIRVILFTLLCCWKTCMKFTFLGVSPVHTHVIQAVEQKRIQRLTSESSGQCTTNSMLDRDSMRNQPYATFAEIHLLFRITTACLIINLIMEQKLSQNDVLLLTSVSTLYTTSIEPNSHVETLFCHFSDDIAFLVLIQISIDAFIFF